MAHPGAPVTAPDLQHILERCPPDCDEHEWLCHELGLNPDDSSLEDFLAETEAAVPTVVRSAA